VKRSALTWVGVAIVVLGGVAWLVTRGSTVKAINEQLQASTGQLQLKRALTLSEAALETLAPADLLISITASDLKRLEPNLKAALGKARALKEARIEVANVQLEMSQQSLSAAISLAIPIDVDTDVQATLYASALIGATPSALHWNLRYDGLWVDKVTTASRLDDVAVQAIAMRLLSLKPLLNAILDETVNDNPETAVLAQLNQDRIIAENLAESSTSQLRIEPYEISWSMQVESTGLWIDEKGLLLAARIAFVPPQDVPTGLPNFPSDDFLATQDGDGVRARISAYRTRFMKIVEDSFPDAKLTEISSRSVTGVALTTKSFATLFKKQFGSAPVMGTLTIAEPESSSSEVTFAISERNCREVFDACDYQDVCSQNACKHTVKKSVSRTCEYSCCLNTGLLGCLFWDVCKRACDEVVEVVEDVNSPVCEAFRAADRLHQGVLCKVASNLDNAVCDIDANVRKAVCDVGQEVRRFYENNPVATVRASVQPNVTLQAQIADATLADDLSRLSAVMSASGGGPIRARLEYDKHNYTQDILTGGLTLGLTCVVDWTESVDLEVSAQVDSLPVAFSSTFESMDSGILKWRLTQTDPVTVFADFSPAPLVALFGGKPQITLNCPLLLTGALVWATGEAVLKEEKVREVLPLLTGENFPQTIRNNSFEISIEPLQICPLGGSCEEPWVKLVPRIGQDAITFTQRPSDARAR